MVQEQPAGSGCWRGSGERRAVWGGRGGEIVGMSWAAGGAAGSSLDQREWVSAETSREGGHLSSLVVR